MDIRTWIRVQRTIIKTARINGKTPLQCRRDMQTAIDEGWKNACADPELKAIWASYFPSGQKPSLEEFIVVLAGQLDGPKM